MKRKAAKPFRPPMELRTPIPWSGPKPPYAVKGLLETDEEFELRKKTVEAEVKQAFDRSDIERMRRLLVLAKHMGIETQGTDWLLIFAMKLAMALCPKGFTIELRDKTVGRPKRWTDVRYTELLADVEKIKAETNSSDTAACRKLVQRAKNAGKGRYLPRGNSSVEAATTTLVNRLNEARNPSFNKIMLFTEMRPDAVNQELKQDAEWWKELMMKALVESFASPEIVRP